MSSEGSHGKEKGLRRAPVEGEVVGRAPRARRDEEFDEGPSEADIERFSGVTRTCPACGKEIFDDAEVCYHCGEALGGADRAKGPPVWVIITAILVIGAFVVVFVIR